MPNDPMNDEAWRELAETFAKSLLTDWLSRMPEGLIFDLSLPSDCRNGKSTLRIQRIPDSDEEAISLARDRHERIPMVETVDDGTLKDARQRWIDRFRLLRRKKADRL